MSSAASLEGNGTYITPALTTSAASSFFSLTYGTSYLLLCPLLLRYQRCVYTEPRGIHTLSSLIPISISSEPHPTAIYLFAYNDSF